MADSSLKPGDIVYFRAGSTRLQVITTDGPYVRVGWFLYPSQEYCERTFEARLLTLDPNQQGFLPKSLASTVVLPSRANSLASSPSQSIPSAPNQSPDTADPQTPNPYPADEDSPDAHASDPDGLAPQ